MLAQVEQCSWDSGPAPIPGVHHASEQDIAVLSARAAGRFRVLSVRKEEVEPSKPPLFVAHVQLLEDRDLQRGAAAEAWNYWMCSSPNDDASWSISAEDSRIPRAQSVKAGTALKAKLGAPIFESPESWGAVAQVPAGITVVAAGEPRVIEGYLMVPILPSGAVELTLFREVTPSGEATMPSEADLRSTLLKLGQPA